MDIVQSNLNIILVLFFNFFLFGDTSSSNNISFEVMSGFVVSSDQSAMSLHEITEYSPRAVVWLVSIFKISWIWLDGQRWM